MEKDRNEVLQDFGHALAALISSAMPDVTPEGARELGSALKMGVGTIQVLVNLEPFTIVGSLRWADRSRPPLLLFRIDAGSPPEMVH